MTLLPLPFDAYDGLDRPDTGRSTQPRRLFIQIPCLNEADTLPATLAGLPRHVPGFDRVDVLVVDDGSIDGTAKVARDLGVAHVIRLHRNQGLARVFMIGLQYALKCGADVIVNTDGDNQYCGDCIPDLVKPIVEGRADIVIGTRPISKIEGFSRLKKFLQILGSRVVSRLSGIDVGDATSGLRAFNRKSAASLNIFGRYTYTIESLIQAGRKNLAVVCVPVRVNRASRPSRLIRSTSQYIFQALMTMIRIGILYYPMRFFMGLSIFMILPGLVLGIRFLVFLLEGGGQGHIQSLLLAVTLVVCGILSAMAGILADMNAANRMLLEELCIKQRLENGGNPV